MGTSTVKTANVVRAVIRAALPKSHRMLVDMMISTFAYNGNRYDHWYESLMPPPLWLRNAS